MQTVTAFRDLPGQRPVDYLGSWKGLARSDGFTGSTQGRYLHGGNTMVRQKDVKAVGKFLDRLTAVYIHNNPGALKHFGKERIRDSLLNEQLRLAFQRLDS